MQPPFRLNFRKTLTLGSVILLLLSCSGKETRQPSGTIPTEGGKSPSTSPSPSPSPTPTPGPSPTPNASLINGKPVPVEAAAKFDKFLHKQLTPNELDDFVSDCNQDPKANIFCYSVLNYDDLRKRRRHVKESASRRSKPIRPKWTNGEIANWDDLIAAPINALIRGLGTQSPTELQKLQAKATATTKCPNNLATALAATMEDFLPERITAGEIALLYQRGAECSEAEGPDREMVLTRSALFYFLQKQYTNALRLLTKATAVEDTYLGRALYWTYRTKTELGDKEGAKKALENLRVRYPFSFHSVVALLAAGQDPGDVLSKSFIPNLNRSTQFPNLNILLEQLDILRRLGYVESSAEVLNWTIQESEGAEPELRLYLATLKDGPTDYRQKISVMTEVLYKNPSLVSKETLEQYFPKVYFPVFQRNEPGLDPFLLLSIARQESAFNPNAISHARARGLLQMLPATAKRYRKKAANLFDPDQNVDVASKYLMDLLTRTNGQIHLSLTAYNAGENRIAEWTGRYPATEPILFIDLIPFRETREYVASVLRNYYWYRRIHLPKEILPTKKLFDAEVSIRN